MPVPVPSVSVRVALGPVPVHTGSYRPSRPGRPGPEGAPFTKAYGTVYYTSLRHRLLYPAWPARPSWPGPARKAHRLLKKFTAPFYTSLPRRLLYKLATPFTIQAYHAVDYTSIPCSVRVGSGSRRFRFGRLFHSSGSRRFGSKTVRFPVPGSVRGLPVVVYRDNPSVTIRLSIYKPSPPWLPWP